MATRNMYPYANKDLVLKKHSINTIASSFRVGKETDRVSKELRGLLHASINKEETLRALTNTFQTHLYYNIKEDPHREAKKQLNKVQNRAQKLKGILKSGGTGFEFFMVDCLQRNRFHFKNTKLFHTKASPRLDHERKVDFLSTVVHGGNILPNNITVGVQLTTEKSHINMYPDYRAHMKKKKQTVHELSQKCIDNPDPYIQQLPDKLKPNLTSYMVVNGSVNKLINIDNNNIFLKAFEQREKNEFSLGGPSQYLPDGVQKELGIIYHAYQRSLKQFIEFLETNIPLPETEKYSMIHHEDIYHLVSEYNPENKELQYKVFYNNEKGENVFLFYISYFLHDNLLKNT